MVNQIICGFWLWPEWSRILWLQDGKCTRMAKRHCLVYFLV